MSRDPSRNPPASAVGRFNLSQAKLKIERLERLLEAERDRAENAWNGYRSVLYENVDLKIKFEEIQKILSEKEN